MLTLQRVLFVLAFVFLSIHSVRLSYHLWFEVGTSVLDAYDEAVEVDIRKATSLEQLVQRYESAHKKVEDYEADETNPRLEPYERNQTEPYQSEHLLREAIVDWERKSREIAKIRVYWLSGLFFLVVGIAAYKWANPWLGIAALIAAFSEMVYWSSPSYFSGRSHEFERLLQNKLAFAAASMVLLMVVAVLTRSLSRDQRAS